jgi:hypothetical protein
MDTEERIDYRKATPEVLYQMRRMVVSMYKKKKTVEEMIEVTGVCESIPVNHNLCQLQKKEPRGKLRLHLSRMTTTHSKPEVHHELYTEQQDRASVKIHYDHRRGHRQ